MTVKDEMLKDVTIYKLTEILREINSIAIEGYKGLHDEDDLRDILRSIAEHTQLASPNDHD